MRIVPSPRKAAVLLALVTLAACGAPPAWAQAPTPAESMNAVLRPLAQPGMPGCAAGVVQGGVLTASGAYGLADVENESPIGPGTRFDIGSMSKQFLAMTILMLQADGQLSLDDEVHRFVPELPAYSAKITLRDLLHHTSGLKDYDQLLQLAGWVDGDLKSAADIRWIITRQRTLAFQPGTQHSYSDANYFLLGMIAERVTGRPLAALMEDRIFRPLGMTHTSLRTDRWALIPHKAWPYEVEDGKTRLFVNAEEPLGDGGVFSTVSDLALWERNFDDAKVGGRAVIEQMHRVRPLTDGTPNDYAAGLYMRSYHGLRMVEHSGASYGYLAEKIRFPAQRLSVIVLCNRRDGPYVEISNRLADLFLPPRPSEPELVTLNTHKAKLADLAGVYFSEAAADGVLIEARDSAVFDAGSDREFRQTGPLTFVGSPTGTLCRCALTYTFQLGPDGRAQGFTSSRPAGSSPGLMSTSYRRMPAVAKPALADYAGEYVSDDLATAWCVVRRGDGLAVRRRGFADRGLSMIWRDGAAGPGGILQFKRQGGRVNGFELRNIRLNSVGFHKLPAGRHPVPAAWRCA
jgi:CubicO group peptidase (beta-lactamase class C family)